MDSRNDTDPRTSVGKALDVLRALGEDAHEGVGVSELARRANLSKSTVHRLLASMRESGAISKQDTLYRSGPLFVELQAPPRKRRHNRLRELLTPYLVDLYSLTKLTVYLATLDGPEVVYLNKLHGVRAVRSPVQIGGNAPAYSTAVGKSLLAFQPDAVERLRPDELVRWTPMTLQSIPAITAELSRIRSQGIAVDRGETVADVRCIAAPVLGGDGHAVAALSVSWNSGASFIAEHAAYVRTVARDASRALRRHATEDAAEEFDLAAG